MLTALWLVNLAAALLCGQAQSTAATVLRVPATANPYLAGMPRGAKARYEDRAPEQSPVLVELSLIDATAVTFTASGRGGYDPRWNPKGDPPDGSIVVRHEGGAENGISDITAPVNSLVGVFLDDDRPDRSRPPRALNFGAMGKNALSVSPQLKQVFFIGAGTTKSGGARRFLIPKGATRLFLGTMDGYEWNNNSGLFSVAVTIERSDVSSSLFSVDSRIAFSKWACLPNRSLCTPETAIVEETGVRRYHVLLPAQLEWGAAIPTPIGATVKVQGASGTACLDSQSRSTSSCNGPQGNGTRAGQGFLAPDDEVGALVVKTIGDRTFFSVNDRTGSAFQSHQGYFEFDVTIP